MGLHARSRRGSVNSPHPEDLNVDDILARLQGLFRDVLDQPSLMLTLRTDAESIEGYDSLAHINILTAVEQEFGVHFELQDILSLENAGDLVALVQRKRKVAA